jgi:hypothetical protein
MPSYESIFTADGRGGSVGPARVVAGTDGVGGGGLQPSSAPPHRGPPVPGGPAAHSKQKQE